MQLVRSPGTGALEFTEPSAVQVLTLNHWTTREFPVPVI